MCTVFSQCLLNAQTQLVKQCLRNNFLSGDALLSKGTKASVLNACVVVQEFVHNLSDRSSNQQVLRQLKNRLPHISHRADVVNGRFVRHRASKMNGPLDNGSSIMIYLRLVREPKF